MASMSEAATGGGKKPAGDKVNWKTKAAEIGAKADEQLERMGAAKKKAKANAAHTGLLVANMAETQVAAAVTSGVSGALNGTSRSVYRIVRGASAFALVAKGLHNALMNGRGSHEMAVASGLVAAEASETMFGLGSKAREKWWPKLGNAAPEGSGSADAAALPAAQPSPAAVAPPPITLTPPINGQIGDVREIGPAELNDFINRAKARV